MVVANEEKMRQRRKKYWGLAYLTIDTEMLKDKSFVAVLVVVVVAMLIGITASVIFVNIAIRDSTGLNLLDLI